MKAVLMSIKPKWCEKIFSGEKTIEVRKVAPKLDPPFKVYVYRTKDKVGKAIVNEVLNGVYGGGKVVGEFVCDKVRAYIPFGLRGFELFPEWLKEMCLSKEQLDKYGGLKTLYGWHITAPKLYDKPKGLSEFLTPSGTGDVWGNHYLSRPPQSWMYVEELC